MSNATDLRAAEASALRAMTPEQKLLVAQALRATARALAAVGVRSREPDLDPAAVEARVREIFDRADA